MLKGFLCPWHWLLIDFNVIRNCIQKFVLDSVSLTFNKISVLGFVDRMGTKNGITPMNRMNSENKSDQ